MSGPNYLRWDCDKSGCFNKVKRPKIEQFHGCFPRNSNFGDVDGLVELGGAFCLLEWKSDGGALKHGQRRALEAFVRLHQKNVVFVVDGDAATMKVNAFQILMRNGSGAVTWTSVEDTSFEDLRTRIARWATWIEGP
jgi:hypothetical protein